MHTSNVLRNNLFSHKTEAYLDHFKIIKSILRKYIGQNDRKQKNNVGYCPPKDYPSYAGKSHTRQDTTQIKTFIKCSTITLLVGMFKLFHFFIVGLER